MSLSEEILILKTKKALQFSEIEMLSVVNDAVYLRFGKTVADIMIKEKQLLRESNNDLNEGN